MKRVNYLFLIISFLAILVGCGGANMSTPTGNELKVSDIIRQMPAENSQRRDELAAELVALNPEATILLSKMLLPPTDPNDTAARYGLSALTHYTARNGAEAERAVYVAALIDALAIVPEKQNQAFLISQLHLVGKEEAAQPLAGFLNDDILCDYAARALLTINAGGTEKAFLKALDSANDANKATIIHALGQLQSKSDTKQTPAGFVSLFNGTDLTGWKGLLAKPYDNPIKRAELTPEKLADEQKKADELMRKHWKVVDGILEFDGGGFSLATIKNYEDFEMLVDWKIVHPKGDSGIYLRGTPQVQIWDPAQHKVGSGGLYNNKKNPSKPSMIADNPIGQWNTFRIKMIGEKVTVHLNGKLIVDNVTLENYWDRSQPIFPSEQIELQCHGDPIHFKNIFIREIRPLKNDKPINTLTEQEKADGFVSLFNGTDLTSWVGATDSYGVKDGILFCRKGTGRNIYTEKEYDNFVLRFEIKLKPGTNNGLGIRTPIEGDAAYVGMELQILDNTAEKYSNLHNWQYHGSIYGIAPAKRSYLKPVGQWNFQEVIADGTHITVNLNGTTIVDADIKDASKNGTLSGKQHPGLFNKTGHIGFLGHGDYVEFRNLRIKEL